MNDEPEIDYSQIEKEILEETNNLRTNPKGFITVLENHLKMFEGEVYTYPGRIGIRTREGVAAVKEAITYLKDQKVLSKLSLDPSLCKAARDHANDTGPKGLTGHDGSDGSTVSDRVERYCKWTVTLCENIDYGIKPGQLVVLSLLVDDGVKTRGHRKNLLNEKLKYIGIGCGYHEKYGMMSVCDYTGGIEAKSVISAETSNKVVVENKKVSEITNKLNSVSVGNNATTTSKSPIKQVEAKQEKYSMSTDPDCPKGAVSASVKVSTKISGGQKTTTTIKTYTMKDGTKQVVEKTTTE